MIVDRDSDELALPTSRALRALLPTEGQMLMTGPVDAELRDDAGLDEIEMSTNLMIATSDSPDSLTQAEVDAALGL